jgi:dihydrofolate synthase/folylpolyglutamate synthase
MKVYLSLGSNLGDRLANLDRALELLGRGGCRVVKRSPVYETAPLYYLAQPAFFNLAAACETSLSPEGLLALIARVERALLRRRLFRNCPRTVDVDILFYGNFSLARPGLNIPHPRLAEREFVLAPLADIAPGLRHPVTGRTVKELLAALPQKGGARRLPADYAGLEAWLAALPPPSAAAHYSLGRIKIALARLGSPEKRMGTVVHIAGSTGKTSTAFMAAAALSACGHRTGLYTSPHVRGLRERIKLDGRDIPETDLLRCFMRAESVSAGELSFFETLTAVAFQYFAEQGTRFAVVEAGLGGRLDSTNVVPGGVACLTSVSMEHVGLLGPRLADIAAHKAGIIKKGCAVAAGFGLPPEAARAVSRRAAAAGAVVHLPDPQHFAAGPEGRGAFQPRNAALALKAAGLAAARAGARFLPARAAAAAAKAVPPGRFEPVRAGGRRVIVDGAHNPEGVAALLREFRGAPPVCVASFMADKDIPRLASALAAASSRLVLTRSLSYRAAPPEQVAKSLTPEQRHRTVIEADPRKALELALRLAPAAGSVLVAGSLYLAGDALAALEGRRAFHPREMLITK